MSGRTEICQGEWWVSVDVHFSFVPATSLINKLVSLMSTVVPKGDQYFIGFERRPSIAQVVYDEHRAMRTLVP